MEDFTKLWPMIIMAASAIQFTRWMTVATYSLQVYEWLICFSDEYLYVHKARWTSVKLAYLICRYYPLFFFPVYLWALVGNHTTSVCAKYTKAIYILVALMPMISQAVFIIRTYAFTGRNKFVLAFLISGWMALLVFILWTLIAQYVVFLQMHTIFGPYYACIVEDPSLPAKAMAGEPIGIDTIGVYALASFCFDSVMTALVFIHCIRFRTTWGPLGKAFIGQGLIAYALMSSIDLVISVVLLMPDGEHDGLAILRTPTSCIIACRLILTFRRRADPTATTQAHNMSKLVQDAIDRLADAEPVIDDAEGDHDGPIERWD